MKKMANSSMVDVAIIGAGPYGLSLAAHLRALGVDFRIFGCPMHTWLTQMPKGMRLKSEGFASSLYDPDSAFTLAHYCRLKAIPYADIGVPVSLDTFISYGLEFQRRFVPEVENKLVVSLQRASGGFRIGFADGDVVDARKVVIAVGISHFGYVPPVLSALSEEFASHSSKHSILDGFKGREVSVVGAGASALDLAALLHQVGASVQLLARKPVIRFHDPPGPQARSLFQRMRLPRSGLGSGWRVFFFAHAPQLFHRLPERLRLEAVRRTLGPAPAWFTKQQVVGKVPLHLGVHITQAHVQNGRVNLEIADNKGDRRTLVSDHVIAATGYKVDLGRLPFLDLNLLAEIRSVEQSPVLSPSFESSVPGLYFVGASAANSFGPVLRFALGAGFTARRLSRHLERSASRDYVRSRSTPGVQALEGGRSLDVIP
jgi:thioredoxin reductase